MRAQLLHLSGPLRGRTDTYSEEHLLIGTDPDAQVRFGPGSPVRPRHAEIAFQPEDCVFLLRRIDGAVFVNHREVEEIFLQPDDLLEFGQDGPRARFRIQVEEGRVCKPVRQMLGDASDAARESGALEFTRSFVHDLFTHATWQLKVGFPVAALLVLMPLSYLAGWFGARRPIRQQADAYARELDAVREQLDRVAQAEAQNLSHADIDALRAEFAQRAAVLDRMLANDAALRLIHDRYRNGVCLIHGSYAFEQQAQGSPPVRFRSSDGAEVEISYVGSGFLASADGHLITNRHVVEPWLHDEETEMLQKLGFHPVFTHLSVTFPGQPPIAADPATVRVRQDDIDVAVLQVKVSGVPVLPLYAGDVHALQGTHAILVGYPTGVNALLAKADASLAEQLTSGPNVTLTSIIDGLAQHGAITPLITEGVLSEVLDKKLVYDAKTTHGGSGGPVFGADGSVIGVNFAILREFDGSNFGVPIRFARELLP